MKFELSKVKGALDKRAPEILLVTGVIGVVATAILAARGATKAADILQRQREEEEKEPDTKELVKAYATAYAPAVASGAITIASIIASHKITSDRLASLANAYVLADNSFKMYKEKVKEAIGEKKEGNIRDEVVKERLANNPLNNGDVVVIGTGDVLCFDCLSGRYFKSTMNKIQKAVNDVNEVMKSDNYISLNEFYDHIGLPHIDIGEELGWSAGKYVDVRFSTILSTDDSPTGEGVPCLALEYLIGPRYDYRDVW